ncbi:uncharacterized protein LOC132066761 [Lycium ferocissimum]|uniref:uncharacterized protein LOC132066761 n=1 Tax=Lycium ferocissimum TaxID=112874 RepID=UPI0028156844|nr:uncharacterized protein LOC132066761 [Lycium ferocissimum]
MAENLIGGAALGQAFRMLSESMIQASNTSICYDSNFQRLNSTLLSIKPVLEDIERLNKALEGRESEIEIFKKRLEEGEKLVSKSVKIKRYNVCKRWYYSKKLADLEKSTMKFFEVHGLMQTLRDRKQILVALKEEGEKLDEIYKILKNMKLDKSRVISTR